jgi:subtilisin family serine protease
MKATSFLRSFSATKQTLSLGTVLFAGTALAADSSLKAPEVEKMLAQIRASQAYVLGEVVVQYRTGARAETQEASRIAIGARAAETLMTQEKRVDGHGDLVRLKIGDGQSMDEALRLLKNDPDVEDAEPIWTVAAEPEDYEPFEPAADSGYALGEVLVQYRAEAQPAELSATQNALGVIEAQTLLPKENRSDGLGDLRKLKLRDGLSMEDAIRALNSDPNVEYAEPNWMVFNQAVSDDPAYLNGNLWGMYGATTTPSNAFGSHAGEAWLQDPTCDDVYVAVMDEGIMRSHPDLQANMWVNSRDPRDGLDNDGNGYIDDNFGWDFHNGDRTVYDNPRDDHGTHVAGTIAAVGGNGRGVAGVCWSGIKIIPLKVLSGKGEGSVAALIRAIDYLIDLKNRQGLSTVLINMSLGAYGFQLPHRDIVSLEYAIERAGRAGILAVAAAGNGKRVTDKDGNTTIEKVNIDRKPFYPASYDLANILSVGAIDRTGGHTKFSNYGTVSVDIAAPGVTIRSTIPDPTTGAASYGELRRDDGYLHGGPARDRRGGDVWRETPGGYGGADQSRHPR